MRKKDDGKIYAMKSLLKQTLFLRKKLRYAVTEANILKKINHQFILHLHYSFQTPRYLYLIVDYCEGGDLLYQLLIKRTFSERQAKFYIAELILAIEHLHMNDIFYRDLKPENILIDREGHIKLADFGLSKENVGENDIAPSFCGSPAYLAPEMLKRQG